MTACVYSTTGSMKVGIEKLLVVRYSQENFNKGSPGRAGYRLGTSGHTGKAKPRDDINNIVGAGTCIPVENSLGTLSEEGHFHLRNACYGGNVFLDRTRAGRT